MKNQKKSANPVQKNGEGGRDQDRFLIIGSGITGLCAGAMLAELGHKVRVLEAHPQYLGGHSRTLTFNDVKFSAGPQFVWNFVAGEDPVSRRVLRFLGIEGAVPFQTFDPNCQDRFFLGNQEPVDIPKGLSEFSGLLASKYPGEKRNIEKFFKYLEALFQGSVVLHDRGVYLTHQGKMILEIARSDRLRLFQKLKIARFYNATLADMFNAFLLSPEVKRILYAHGGIFAENANQISAGVYAAATGYCHQGIAFPTRGFESLITELGASIQKNGGDALLGKEVTQIKVEGSHVEGVVCRDGATYPCDYLISNIPPRLACRMIPGCSPEGFRYEPSNALVGCYLALKDYPQLHEIGGKNYWWQAYPESVDYDNPDLTQEPKMLYIGSESENGVRYESQKAGLQTLTIFLPGNYQQAKDFYHKGEKEYLGYKKGIANQVVGLLEKRLFPDISSYLEFIEVVTPMDIQLELGAEAGNVYGRKLDVKNMLRKVKGIKGVDNLKFACATMGTPGIETGFQTAAALIHDLLGVTI